MKYLGFLAILRKSGFQSWKLQKSDLPKNSSRAQFADSHDKNWVHQFTTLVSPPFWVHKLLSVHTQTVHRAISTRQHRYRRSNFSFLRQTVEKTLECLLFKLDSKRNFFCQQFHVNNFLEASKYRTDQV